MYLTTILAATLAISGLVQAKPSVLSRGKKVPNEGCLIHSCDVILDGQFDCNGTATFNGSTCYERGAGRETQPVRGCAGIEVEYRVDGKNGAGSGDLYVGNSNDTFGTMLFKVSDCGPYPIHPPVPMGDPCVGTPGNCTVA